MPEGLLEGVVPDFGGPGHLGPQEQTSLVFALVHDHEVIRLGLLLQNLESRPIQPAVETAGQRTGYFSCRAVQ